MGTILDCPFCGDFPDMEHIGNHATKSRAIKMRCRKCRIERTDRTTRIGFEWLQEVAVKNWNQRPVNAKDATISALESEVEAWKLASGLEDSHGDPDGVRPEHLSKSVEALEARVADLEVLRTLPPSNDQSNWTEEAKQTVEEFGFAYVAAVKDVVALRERVAELEGARDVAIEALHWMYCTSRRVGRNSKVYIEDEEIMSASHAQKILSKCERLLTPDQVATALAASTPAKEEGHE